MDPYMAANQRNEPFGRIGASLQESVLLSGATQPREPFFEALTGKTIILGQLLGQLEHVTSCVRSRVFGATSGANEAGAGAAANSPPPSMYDATMLTMDEMIKSARRALDDAEALYGNL